MVVREEGQRAPDCTEPVDHQANTRSHDALLAGAGKRLSALYVHELWAYDTHDSNKVKNHASGESVRKVPFGQPAGDAPRLRGKDAPTRWVQ